MINYLGQDKYLERVEEDIKDIYLYFDNLSINVNDLSSLEDCRTLIEREKEVQLEGYISNTIDDYHPFDLFEHPAQTRTKKRCVGYTLNLKRPSIDLLVKLAVVLARSDYTVSNIEISLDFITESVQKAYQLMEFLVPYVVVVKIKRNPTLMNDKDSSYSSAYFETYADDKMFKMYLLDGSRKHRRPALHTEYIFRGAESLAKEGIGCLSDLVCLDVSWYKKRMKFMQSNRSECGRLLRLAKGDKPASPEQCRNDFKEEFSDYLFLSHAIYFSKYKLRSALNEWPYPQ